MPTTTVSNSTRITTYQGGNVSNHWDKDNARMDAAQYIADTNNTINRHLTAYYRRRSPRALMMYKARWRAAGKRNSGKPLLPQRLIRQLKTSPKPVVRTMLNKWKSKYWIPTWVWKLGTTRKSGWATKQPRVTSTWYRRKGKTLAQYAGSRRY